MKTSPLYLVLLAGTILLHHPTECACQDFDPMGLFGIPVDKGEIIGAREFDDYFPAQILLLEGNMSYANCLKLRKNDPESVLERAQNEGHWITETLPVKYVFDSMTLRFKNDRFSSMNLVCVIKHSQAKISRLYTLLERLFGQPESGARDFDFILGKAVTIDKSLRLTWEVDGSCIFFNLSPGDSFRDVQISLAFGARPSGTGFKFRDTKIALPQPVLPFFEAFLAELGLPEDDTPSPPLKMRDGERAQLEQLGYICEEKMMLPRNHYVEIAERQDDLIQRLDTALNERYKAMPPNEKYEYLLRILKGEIKSFQSENCRYGAAHLLARQKDELAFSFQIDSAQLEEDPFDIRSTMILTLGKLCKGALMDSVLQLLDEGQPSNPSKSKKAATKVAFEILEWLCTHEQYNEFQVKSKQLKSPAARAMLPKIYTSLKERGIDKEPTD